MTGEFDGEDWRKGDIRSSDECGDRGVEVNEDEVEIEGTDQFIKETDQFGPGEEGGGRNEELNRKIEVLKIEFGPWEEATKSGNNPTTKWSTT